MAEQTANGSLLVVELGKFSKKKIKKLSKGTGQVSDTIKESLQALKAEGTVAATAQTVVFVVKEKPKKSSLLGIG